MNKREILDKLRSIPVKRGHFPKIQDISKILEIPQYQVSRILKGLSECGELNRIGNWYQFKHQEEPQEIPEIPQENVRNEKEIIQTLRKHPPEFITKEIYLPIIRWTMLILGIFAAVMSAYYTSIWAKTTQAPIFAWMLSLIIVIFSFASFQTVLAIFQSKTKHWYTKAAGMVLFSLLWIAITAFSIGSTIAGQYNNFIKAQNEKELSTKDVTKNTSQYDELVSKENELKESRRLLVEQLAPLLSITKGITNADQLIVSTDEGDKRTERSKIFYDAQSRIVGIQYSISQLDKSLEKVRADKNTILNKGSNVLSINNRLPDFYEWLSKVLNTDKELAQFWMALMPAIALDLISPMSLAIFLFLGRKKDEIIL